MWKWKDTFMALAFYVQTSFARNRATSAPPQSIPPDDASTAQKTADMTTAVDNTPIATRNMHAAADAASVKAYNIPNSLDTTSTAAHKASKLADNLRAADFSFIAADRLRLVVESRPTHSSRAATQIMSSMEHSYVEPITLHLLASRMGLHPNYLSTVIKQELGISYTELIARLRVGKSVELLDNPRLTVKEIAVECGYENVNTFIRNFKRLQGMTPGQYRKRHRSN